MQSASANSSSAAHAGSKTEKKNARGVTVNCHGDNLQIEKKIIHLIKHLLLDNDVLACQSCHYTSLTQIVI